MKRFGLRVILPVVQGAAFIGLVVGQQLWGRQDSPRLAVKFVEATNLPALLTVRDVYSQTALLPLSPVSAKPADGITYIPSTGFFTTMDALAISLLWYIVGLWLDRRLGLVAVPSEPAPEASSQVVAWLTLWLFGNLALFLVFWRLVAPEVPQYCLPLAAWFSLALVITALRIRQWKKVSISLKTDE